MLLIVRADLSHGNTNNENCPHGGTHAVEGNVRSGPFETAFSFRPYTFSTCSHAEQLFKACQCALSWVTNSLRHPPGVHRGTCSLERRVVRTPRVSSIVTKEAKKKKKRNVTLPYPSWRATYTVTNPSRKKVLCAAAVANTCRSEVRSLDELGCCFYSFRRGYRHGHFYFGTDRENQ